MSTSASAPGPLFLQGWLEFNRERWGFQPVRERFSEGESATPAIDSVLYLDNRGRIRQPSGNAYLALSFRSSDTGATSRLYRQWLEVADLLAASFVKRGLGRGVSLPPELFDLRPWQWHGFRAGVRYTFYIDFPYHIASSDHAVRKNIRKSRDAGYRVERIGDMQAVHACLVDTERRQGFSHELRLEHLQLLRTCLGDEHCRAYVAYAATGQPVSARIVLHEKNSRAIDWVAGTDSAHLRSGVTQQLIAFMLDDLQAAGASGFDFAGANRRSIAAAKATWGAQLTPYYYMQPVDARFVASALRDVVLGAMRRGRRMIIRDRPSS